MKLSMMIKSNKNLQPIKQKPNHYLANGQFHWNPGHLIKDYIQAAGGKWTDQEKLSHLQLLLNGTPRQLLEGLQPAKKKPPMSHLIQMQEKNGYARLSENWTLKWLSNRTWLTYLYINGSVMNAATTEVTEKVSAE
ncbi:hypothetical protein GPALN_004513 [Globodera pallida]|nr:hypothetical protein GPALN_004513 [Globodera pallida]